jgi:hypothetical protein
VNDNTGKTVSTAPLQRGEQVRFAVARRGVALTGRPVIIAQSEQGWLMLNGRRLGAAKRHQVPPEVAAAIYLDEAGECHGGKTSRLKACGAS